ncbi:endonuclease/exonuclease/phosphatase family protein [Phocaeicola sartorii]|uniref:endonuclease/exonuclease/phosphatase family protein n=1 Tax=Phocaeicola sartorii TaxID=671267 RepID=UPI002593078A|nr:endonuclease/exonuclease/phosphatase family protein [Phocaeicola sartorii]
MEYNYLFDKTGSIGDAANEIKVSVTKGVVYRFLFLCTTADNIFPDLASGKTYWDLEAYAPQLPLADPMAMLVSRGNEKDGTLRVVAASASVQVTLAPRASKVVLQKDPQTASDITVNSVTFADAASSVPYAHIEPQHYSEYENLPVATRKTYQCAPQEDVCYMLPDMCAGTFGVNATLHITHPISGEQDVRVTVPVGLALNVGSGKTYYIEMSADANGKVAATWATHVAPRTLKLATQNLWGKSTSVVLDYFNRIDVDVLCAQECSNLSESDIQAQGLYVHTHSNNGQGKCSIISRYPFSGITPNKYGVYIDLGEGIVVLVMNCHGAFKPYGPYQLNGIDYGGYPATDNVDEVVRVNKEVRQGMVDKLLEDFNSSTTPFVCLSGDFNEPSWLDWTEGALTAGLAPYVVQWPTTRSLWEGGIKGDAYRTIHPDPVTHPGFTWTPRPSEKDTKDRLDLTLYTLSPRMEVKSCQVIGENTETSDIVLPDWGPFEEVFDHRGLRTEFVFTK